MTIFTNRNERSIVATGALAGLAGGLAEVAWIWVYGKLGYIDAGSVARGVSEALGVETVADPILFGIGVHMALAVALGIALAHAIQPLLARAGTGHLLVYASVISALAVVWAVNFLIVLPILSPGFIGLVPYAAGFLSKILFGVAAAAVLGSQPAEMRYARARRDRHDVG
ncbi:MAG: hypothetical protein HY245_01285 [Rhizobiales bacterium]|nr:hypothetical protein [Hyphomicrobiales bacterium]MBI3672064.1 hypothetical protein [Hyphomicrobiales bacterium]